MNWCVKHEDVAVDGRRLTFVADAEQLASLKAEAGIEAVNSFTVDVEILRWRKDGLRVNGSAKAAIAQICVVSLDPFDSEVELSFERRFLPEDRIKTTDEVVVSVEEDDPPEGYGPDGVDVFDLAREEFMLVLEPHPRKPGTKFDATSDSPSDAENKGNNPFAALEKLTRKPDGSS